MSDSSCCQYEQSRCHSSNNTLYKDLFSPDKWTRAVWKSLSWLKQLSLKPLFFIFPISFSSLTEVPNLCTLVRCPHPEAGLILEWFKIASWIGFQKIPQENAEANSFNLHVYLNKRHDQIVGVFQPTKENVCACSFLLYDTNASKIYKLTRCWKQFYECNT